jgi:hypothetical protein
MLMPSLAKMALKSRVNFLSRSDQKTILRLLLGCRGELAGPLRDQPAARAVQAREVHAVAGESSS